MNDDQQRPHDDGAEDDATTEPGSLEEGPVEEGLVEESDELDLGDGVELGSEADGGDLTDVPPEDEPDDAYE
ncbi:MAG: hypothetical protein EON52_10065, partial [Actinomycetales bacterium]